MPETNGSGRLDRIEALLDKLAERQREFHILQEHDHERFQREIQQHLTWQVLTQEKMVKSQEEAAAERKRLDALNEQTDKRIAELVLAIRDSIARIPPENLRS
jgi:hypothetical protein